MSRNAPKGPNRLLDNPAVRRALAILAEAHQCARDAGASAAHYAVPVTELRAAGCSDRILHWLLDKGYARHSGARGHAADRLEFGPASRFTATRQAAATAAGLGTPPADSPPAGGDKPDWRDDLGELRFRGRLVRRFRNAASNQRAILNAFQRAGWQPVIANPLPRDKAGANRVKERLHDAIKNLNRGHACRCIQFYGTNGGCSVGWKPVW